MFKKRYNSKLELLRLDGPPCVRKKVGKGQTYRTAGYKTWGELDCVFDAITDPIVVFDSEFSVIMLNKSAKQFFTGCPIGKKCFLTKHKFALACKNCPTWQTLKTGSITTSEILNPKTDSLLLLKTYPVYNRQKKVIKGVVLVGRESNDVSVNWKK